MKYVIALSILFFRLHSFSQLTLRGKVVDSIGTPILGVNVLIVGKE